MTHALLAGITSLVVVSLPVAGIKPAPLVLRVPEAGTGGDMTLSLEKLTTGEGQDAEQRPWTADLFSAGDNQLLSLVPPVLDIAVPLPGADWLQRIESPLHGMHGQQLLEPIGDGAPDKPDQVVNDYDEALNLLTQDLLLMLEDSSVLVIWCFDRSESMHDDQQTIHRLLPELLSELAENRPSGTDLAMAVTSFGESFQDITAGRPVNGLNDVLPVIEQVGVEDTGKERMCSAIWSAIDRYQDFARRRHHRMVLVLLTDESGDVEDNHRNLESVIEAARRTNCRIYVFGRQAVFGHRVAYVSWFDTNSRNSYPKPIDLGPESPFLEQLLTDGFGPRQDAHPSGYGSYEQRRLVWETRGRLFILPGQETNLIRNDFSTYKLERVQAYQPSLASRTDYFYELKARPIPGRIVEIVNTLNPHNEAFARLYNLRREFSPNFFAFRQEAQQDILKATSLIALMRDTLTELEQLAAERRREPSPRWQANYDLLLAQLHTYIVRLSQHVLFLRNWLLNPPAPPTPSSQKQRRWGWKVHLRSELIEETGSDEAAAAASKLLREVIEEHPGTPWAARANVELKGGLGVELRPFWFDIDRPSSPEISQIEL